jgi:two-component system CheB/CheR fusion protein
LERVALPSLLREITPGEALVVWSAGTASGQEAFSVAAAFRRLSDADTTEHPLCIVATDLNRAALLRATRDQWTAGELREVPAEVQEQLFETPGDTPILRNSLRGRIVFVQSDLLAEPPIRFAHLILCRNTVMTYFDRDTRRQAVKRIVAALKPQGYLILGRKEKLPNAWAAAWGMRHLGRKIYRYNPTSH